MIHITTAYLI